MLRIRKVDGPANADFMSAIDQQCLPGCPAIDWSQGYWWIAYDDGMPVAFAGLKPSARFSGVGYLCRAAVLPSHRGRALQKRLIRVRLRMAKRLNWHTVVTDTYDNPASGNSLIACGFRLYTPEYPWSHEGACYWRRTV